jgi:uncharacterized protein (TIGR03086 family)
MDLPKLFERAANWAKSKLAGVKKDEFAAATPCEEWNVGSVIGHMIEVQTIFQGAARGEGGAPPQGKPQAFAGKDPAAEYEQATQATLDAFREPGALEKAGQTLGIGFVDQLIHGWDVAKATGQDVKMPDDLAEAAWNMVAGRMDDVSQRGDFFKAPVPVPDDAPAQDKLIAYSGRKP